MKQIRRHEVKFGLFWSHQKAIENARRSRKAFYAIRDLPEAAVWPVDERHQGPVCKVKDLDKQAASIHRNPVH